MPEKICGDIEASPTAIEWVLFVSSFKLALRVLSFTQSSFLKCHIVCPHRGYVCGFMADVRFGFDLGEIGLQELVPVTLFSGLGHVMAEVFEIAGGENDVGIRLVVRLRVRLPVKYEIDGLAARW